MLGKALLQALLHAVYRNKSYSECQVSMRAHAHNAVHGAAIPQGMLLDSVQLQRCTQESLFSYFLRLLTAPRPANQHLQHFLLSAPPNTCCFV